MYNPQEKKPKVKKMGTCENKQKRSANLDESKHIQL